MQVLTSTREKAFLYTLRLEFLRPHNNVEKLRSEYRRHEYLNFLNRLGVVVNTEHKIAFFGLCNISRDQEGD